MSDVAPLTRMAGQFAAQCRYEELPASAVETVRLGFTDALAALFAGLEEPVTTLLSGYLSDVAGKAEAEALFGRKRLTAEAAALLNATAAHAHDFDDYAYSNHPSAVVVPTIIACSALSPSDGRRMVSAYAVGYEIWGALMIRESGHLHSKGWHPTAVLGPIGAAAAAAHMLGLDADKASMALSLAASHAGGLMANFGSMTKPYHAGRAAEAGIRACRLVSAGMTAQPNALEAPTGLMSALSPAGQVDRHTAPRFGKDWLIERMGLNIKKYPTVGASQRCIDALLALIASTEIPLDRITRIRPRVSVKHAKVMPFVDPATAAEAKFSLSFACAAALCFGKVTLNELQSEQLRDRQLRALMAKVDVEAVDEYDPDYPVAAPYDVVRLDLDDGSTIESSKVRRASGHADNPLSIEDIWKKFVACAEFASVSDSRARPVFDWCQTVEHQASTAALVLFDPS